MLLYGISLIPLDEDLSAADSGLLSPFYAYDTEFDGSSQQSAQILRMLMDRGPDRGYFPETAKSLFYLGHTGARGGGEKRICGRGAGT